MSLKQYFILKSMRKQYNIWSEFLE